MRPEYLLDAEPLVALLSPSDEHHAWALRHLPHLEAPFVTCEPVIVEAFHLLSKFPVGMDRLLEFCHSGAMEIDFRLLDSVDPLRELLRKYRDQPMDLADACLVLLAEQHPQATLITTDRDFLVYRTRNRRQIRLLAPFQ